jgi:hypothetical protein
MYVPQDLLDEYENQLGLIQEEEMLKTEEKFELDIKEEP